MSIGKVAAALAVTVVGVSGAGVAQAATKNIKTVIEVQDRFIKSDPDIKQLESGLKATNKAQYKELASKITKAEKILRDAASAAAEASVIDGSQKAAKTEWVDGTTDAAKSFGDLSNALKDLTEDKAAAAKADSKAAAHALRSGAALIRKADQALDVTPV